MLNIPPGPSVFNIIGIDPGTTFVGVCVMTVDISTMKITSTIATTLNGLTLSNNEWISEIHGNRFGRILALENALLDIFNTYQPLIIISESPFFGGRMPNAFQALVEVICAIRTAVFKYDQWKELKLVPPATVKQAIFCKGNADKFEMKNKILELRQVLNYNGDIPLDTLDEHSVDSIAVAFHYFTHI